MTLGITSERWVTRSRWGRSRRARGLGRTDADDLSHSALPFRQRFELLGDVVVRVVVPARHITAGVDVIEYQRPVLARDAHLRHRRPHSAPQIMRAYVRDSQRPAGAIEGRRHCVWPYRDACFR